MANIVVKKLERTPIDETPVEIVERKGIGHPDSICDGIAESVSVALCKMYKEKLGVVLHHNTDQVELVGGYAYPKLGGGCMINPIYVLLSGRATAEVLDKETGKIVKLPVNTTAVNAAREYLKKALRNIDLEKDVVVDCRIGQGSVDLVEVFDRKRSEIPHANDTSFGVGHAPLSTTEKIVLETEKLLNSAELKAIVPGVGEDIKVMGLREGKKITLTIAMAVVDKYADSLEEYEKVKEMAHKKVVENAQKYLNGHELEVFINTADDEECIFLTVTGTSAEMGDDGSVGRGNRANGLITPFRPMSMEATSGKNPINHIGKIYNILSNIIASDVAELEEVKECQIRILSQIGKPITEPKILSIEVIPENGFTLDDVTKKATEVAEKWLDNIQNVTEKIVEGKVTTF
ncbi:Methionine adenosyltransferase [Methanococcus vannielii SB]|uniref:S-adenosylmethionine synthase n=1 Tax=Methanococcus vannielii (strain ATCC 35089 / DSM 1224 / JCM 13029 / OCM 148 / SB) TaxID=406327 RepID=METK_METVS|nr:methionine adenosyltransferase [Methanococcus vannielii]A6UQS6.1 RecName: Full=S-adenosylmethionine synthase; Short=AdoMet synthase; AltName: Full=Methionine adenosyltransferase [Methanococcus vannielii SB]ABR54848.1 Methionine adenosyltransferase [Methanococcus vannielii SB]